MADSNNDDILVSARFLVPGAFETPLKMRLVRFGVWMVMIALTAWCPYAFDFLPARIAEGADRFGRMLSFTFPPTVWTTWPEWSEALKGLG